MRAAEEWARAQGCVEMASDALIENERSQRAHEALGFDVADRCVHFRTPSPLLRVSYVGMNSYRLAVTEDLNQVHPSTRAYSPSHTPYPNWFTLLSTENAGFANYQAVQVEANHQMAKGIFFQGNYTLAKNLSDAQGDAPDGFTSEVAYGLAVSDRFDLRANRGNVEGTPRHRFQLNGTPTKFRLDQVANGSTNRAGRMCSSAAGKPAP